MPKYTELFKQVFLFIFCNAILNNTYSQENGPVVENNILADIIEDYVTNNEDVVLDPTILYEQLEDLQSNPVDINAASLEQWQTLFFLEPIYIEYIINYKNAFGPFLSIYELQAIPNLNIEVVRKIIPFIRLDLEMAGSSTSILKMLHEGKHNLYLKSEQIIEHKDGYSEERKLDGKAYYLGDPKRLFLRYRFNYSNKLSIGLIAEKDAGEEFFKGSNKAGFDFYSFHLFVRNQNKIFKAIALGDFAVSFGQGLILHAGFGYGKSSYTTLIKRSGPVLSPYTSTLENNYFRGAAATINVSKNIELTGFVSHKFIDANVLVTDSIIEYDQSFSAFQLSGYHRTSSEIVDKHAIKQSNAGGNIKYKFRNGNLSLNTLYTSFDKALSFGDRIDNQFDLSDASLLSMSIDYNYIYQNIYLFGEFAKGDQSSIASVNGALITLDKHLDISILYRHLPVNYHGLNANVFAEGSEPSNENGLYIGAQIYPTKQWTLSAYFDVWKNPWLKYTVNKPGTGSEYLIKLQYTVKRKMDVYVQFRNELKEQNISGESNLYNTGFQNRQNLRININNKITNRLELRNRAEWSFYKAPNGKNSRGFMIYQDILYKPINFPIAFTSRIAFFDTQDYNSRIYAFENELLYGFSILANYFKGMRWYLNVRSRISKNLMIEAGISQTIYTNKNTISSGLEEIQGNHKTEIKAQIKYSF